MSTRDLFLHISVKSFSGAIHFILLNYFNERHMRVNETYAFSRSVPDAHRKRKQATEYGDEDLWNIFIPLFAASSSSTLTARCDGIFRIREFCLPPDDGKWFPITLTRRIKLIFTWIMKFVSLSSFIIHFNFLFSITRCVSLFFVINPWFIWGTGCNPIICKH